MSCILPKYIDEILDTKQFEATMQRYGVTFETLTENRPFITEYLQPHLQKIADDIAEQSGRTEDAQKVKVSIQLADPTQKSIRSRYNHETNEVVVAWSPEKDRSGVGLANDVRHESEHANQKSGDGYSIDQRTLSKLSQIAYSQEGPLYYNNFNEIRARLSEVQMHKARYDKLVKQQAPLEQRLEAANQLWNTTQHLRRHLDTQAQEVWIQGAQNAIRWMWRNTQMIRDVFPEANSTRQAKHMAIDFLQQKAPELFKELQDMADFYRNFADKAQEDVVQEVVSMQEAKNQHNGIEQDNTMKQHEIDRAEEYENHPDTSKDENDEINIDDLMSDEDKFEPQANEEECWDDDEIFDD